MNPHLTIIYGGLSRYDQANGDKPFSGTAGDFFIHRTFDIEPKPSAIDIRVAGTADMTRPYTPGSRFLLLGTEALRFLGQDDNLPKQRGLILTSPIGTPAVATFHPIDCWDLKSYEDTGDAVDDKTESKDVGPTSRANFIHWAILDYRRLMSVPWPLPVVRPSVPYIAPAAKFVVGFLSSISNTHAVLDIETRRQDHSLDCIGVRALGHTVVIPFYRHTNQLFYTPAETAAIYRALYTLLLNPTVTIVGHNLGFDLSVLSFKYNLPLPSHLFDTMLHMHREFPLLEKSLSHALSQYTHATRNHKADSAPNNSGDNFLRLMNYNANDVFYTEQVYLEQLRRIALDADLADATMWANRTLRTTLIMSMTGVRIDVAERDKQVAAQELIAAQYLRCLRILIGDPLFNPESPQQCARFFYEQLRYPVEDITESGAAATGTKTLYKLQLKQPNPTIPLIIAAREAATAAGLLRFRMKQHHVN
jgi:hypothetical protein